MMEQKGFVFSMDVFMSIIVIVFILGISADAMDIAGNRINDFCFEESYQRITEDACDVLIKTSGSPEYWEEMRSFGGVTPGLADTNSSGINKLSMKKIKCLVDHPDLMDKLIPEGFKCSVTVYPLDPSLPTMSLVNQSSKYNSEIFVVNRTVLYSYDSYNIYSTLRLDHGLETNTSHYKCSHSYSQDSSHQWPDFRNDKPGWVCDEFRVGKEDLNSKDFYLLTDPPNILDKNALWMIDRPDNFTDKSEKFLDCPVEINRRIKEVMAEDGVMVLHVYTSGGHNNAFKVYVLGVPTGTHINEVKINYLGLNEGYFVLKIWN